MLRAPLNLAELYKLVVEEQYERNERETLKFFMGIYLTLDTLNTTLLDKRNNPSKLTQSG